MFLNLKDYLFVCLTSSGAYFSTKGPLIGKLTPENTVNILKKHKNRALVLLTNYQLNSIDYPSGTNVETALKITSFKLKEYVETPIADCVYDVMPTHDEQNTGRYYVVSACKSELSAIFENYKISNFKCIDIFENSLKNIANTYITSEKASLVVYVFDSFSYILLMYKSSILSYRKLEVPASEFELWVSEVQRSFDIFERQFRFTSITETIVVNLDESHHKSAEILLKEPKFVTDIPTDTTIPLDVHLAMKGLAFRL